MTSINRMRDHQDTDPMLTDVTRCKGVGPKTVSLLRRVGIATIGDLLHYFPRRHIDRRAIVPIASVHPRETVVIRGEITSLRGSRPSRRLHITQCKVRDETGNLEAIWFNQPYLAKSLSKATKVILSGKVSDRRGLRLENPDIEVLSEANREFLHTVGMVPVYPLTEGLKQKKLRRLIRSCCDDFLDRVQENLPQRLRTKLGLLSRQAALRAMHFPRSPEEFEQARKRIAFQEFLALQLSIQAFSHKGFGAGTALDGPRTFTNMLGQNIPFTLTDSQKGAIAAIFNRMESPFVMNVLLQGDVGSGKTVVAVYAMLRAIESGKQAVLMAPTELLAEQHLGCVRELLKNIPVKHALVSGSCRRHERKHTLTLLQNGEPCLIVGTHALIQRELRIPNAGLIVIDEQHRFGVNQRQTLREKGINPDLLIMTATPIPRTLALVLYGNFETIRIDGLPSGRRPVKTIIIVEESDRQRAWQIIRDEVSKGRQVFVVCPEIGEAGPEFEREVTTVSQAHKEYRKLFPEISIDSLHGRMSSEAREDTINRFRAGAIQLLIATTIIEVGVDVPNASVIVVENADRFGLAQLHQLRGRVGRSRYVSHCILKARPATVNGVRRLETLSSTNDGFEIAEYDLVQRGPGEFLGAAQSGAPPLRVGHLIHDAPLLELARETAAMTLAADPCLRSSGNAPLRDLIGSLPNRELTP